MSNITMDQVAVMGVQYFHYTLDYYLNSMHRCGVKNLPPNENFVRSEKKLKI